jgi:iron-sulfur cluster assembly accessory protein
MNAISVTERATKRVAEILSKEPPGAMFRVSVSGGGCSGFQYGFAIDQSRGEDDIVLGRDGVTVLIDSVSAEYMAGSEVDFVTDLMGQSFRITNPLAKASCGCGTSFTI